jgi:antitoxin component YwqK of YwqJK toxin-antitoxin module
MLHIEYYKDGTPCECDKMERDYYCQNEDGVQTIARESPIINGHHHGIERLYYMSGVLSDETPYVNGKWRGIERQYSSSGVLTAEFLWLDDIILSRPAENFH